MTITEIEHYLSRKNVPIDKNIGDLIENLRLKTIGDNDESSANYYWCLRQIYRIQSLYLSAFHMLKKRSYEDAWCTLDHIDIELGSLEANFDAYQDNDKYHLGFIREMIKKYQKLFPRYLFVSRESIIKGEKCSICGRPVSLRRPCGHKLGRLYMGELCLHEVTDMEFKALALVADPFDKYAYLKIEGSEYDYGVLDKLMPAVASPYDGFQIKTKKIKQPQYRDLGRNDKCPCGSGKKYKRCHMDSQLELMDHYIISFDDRSPRRA